MHNADFLSILTRGLIVAGIVCRGVFAAETPTVTTPAIITPPAGHSAFAMAHARGTQGYVCLPTTPGASTVSWTAKGSRPQATLFQTLFGHDFQVMTHFLSPNTSPNESAPNPLPFGNATWQSSMDSSTVWAQPMAGRSLVAGSDSSCPNTGSIPCLLLEVVGSEAGPAGGKFLTRTTYIQRLNTSGGSAPAEGCSSTADVGNQRLIPYTADYVFYRRDR